MTDSSQTLWIVAAAAIAGMAIVLAAQRLLPRYDWQPVADGHAVIVYDRWTGQFQRTAWDDNGKPHLSDVYTAP